MHFRCFSFIIILKTRVTCVCEQYEGFSGVAVETPHKKALLVSAITVNSTGTHSLTVKRASYALSVSTITPRLSVIATRKPPSNPLAASCTEHMVT